MKPESIEILKTAVVNTYRKIGDDKGLLLRGKRSYTGNEVADEIENETDLRLHMVESIIKLSIELIKRDKHNIEPDEDIQKD